MMTETQKDWAQRLILLALVWLVATLAADMVGQALALVLTWLVQVWFDLHGSPAAVPIIWGLDNYVIIGVDFFLLGFGCCLLLESDWRKAGPLGWLFFGACVPAARLLAYGAPLGMLFGGIGPLAQLAVSAGACFGGAWTAHRRRDDDRVAAFRALVLRTVVFD